MARALAAAVAAVTLTVAAFALAPQTLWSWDARTTDLLFQLRLRITPLAAEPAVVHVDISDSSLNEMGTNEVSRAELGRVVQTLAAAGTRAIALDFVFPGHDQPGDADLIAATAGAKNVLIGDAPNIRQAAAGDVPGRVPRLTVWPLRVEGSANRIPAAAQGFSTFDALRNAAAGTGFLNVSADSDGVYRRAPLLLRVPGGFTPSLALRVAAAVLQVTPDRIVLRPGRSIDLLGARPPNASPGDLQIPIDAQARTRINFSHRWEDAAHIRFVDVLNALPDGSDVELWRRELGGRIVLLADTSTGAADSGSVPIDPRLPLPGLHAAVLSSLVARSFIYEPSPATRILAAILMVGLALLAAQFVRSYWYLAAATALALIYCAAAAVIFIWTGWILPMLPPLTTLVVFSAWITASRYAHEHKTRTLLRRSFESYFAPSVIDKILRNPAAILNTVERKTLTVLFSDIEGFTLRTSTMEPDDVREFLNDYFGAMVRVVFSFGGTVDKFIGDGLMVFFGDPLPQPDHADRAVACALSMQYEIGRVNECFVAAGRGPIRIRVGIATGDVMVGNMGSDQRLSYTVLGATVNMAQRLESHGIPGGVLMSEATYVVLQDKQGAVPRAVTVKGLPQPLGVFAIPAETIQARPSPRRPDPDTAGFAV